MVTDLTLVHLFIVLSLADYYFAPNPNSMATLQEARGGHVLFSFLAALSLADYCLAPNPKYMASLQLASGGHVLFSFLAALSHFSRISRKPCSK